MAASTIVEIFNKAGDIGRGLLPGSIDGMMNQDRLVTVHGHPPIEILPADGETVGG